MASPSAGAQSKPKRLESRQSRKELQAQVKPVKEVLSAGYRETPPVLTTSFHNRRDRNELLRGVFPAGFQTAVSRDTPSIIELQHNVAHILQRGPENGSPPGKHYSTALHDSPAAHGGESTTSMSAAPVSSLTAAEATTAVVVPVLGADGSSASSLVSVPPSLSPRSAAAAAATDPLGGRISISSSNNSCGGAGTGSDGKSRGRDDSLSQKSQIAARGRAVVAQPGLPLVYVPTSFTEWMKGGASLDVGTGSGSRGRGDDATSVASYGVQSSNPGASDYSLGRYSEADDSEGHAGVGWTYVRFGNQVYWADGPKSPQQGVRRKELETPDESNALYAQGRQLGASPGKHSDICDLSIHSVSIGPGRRS